MEISITASLRDVRVVSPAVSLPGLQFTGVLDTTLEALKPAGPGADDIGLFKVNEAFAGVLLIARAHPDHGRRSGQERPVVIAVTDDGTEVPLAEIHALLPAFAKWQLPDTVVYVDAIPRTSVGKIDKKALRAAHADTYRTTA